MQLQLISTKLYEIRGLKVMLGFDLAELVVSEIEYSKRAALTSILRLASDYMDISTKTAYEILRCNFSTLKTGKNIFPYPFKALIYPPVFMFDY